MSQYQIFGPVLALILLTFFVLIYMYARRIPFIRSLDIELNQLTAAEFTRRSPPFVSNPSDNLKNLFEVPVVFYALAVALFAAGLVDRLYIVGSWAFVVLRVLHSAVHCTVNIVIVRFVLYATSCAILFAMVIRAAVSYFF